MTDRRRTHLYRSVHPAYPQVHCCDAAQEVTLRTIMRHGACFPLSPMRSLRLAALVGLAVLALGAQDAAADDDARAEMARALEEQADVEPPPAILPVRSPIVDAPGRSPAPPASTGLARAATAAAHAAEQARGL